MARPHPVMPCVRPTHSLERVRLLLCRGHARAAANLFVLVATWACGHAECRSCGLTGMSIKSHLRVLTQRDRALTRGQCFGNVQQLDQFAFVHVPITGVDDLHLYQGEVGV